MAIWLTERYCNHLKACKWLFKWNNNKTSDWLLIASRTSYYWPFFLFSPGCQATIQVWSWALTPEICTVTWPADGCHGNANTLASPGERRLTSTGTALCPPPPLLRTLHPSFTALWAPLLFSPQNARRWAEKTPKTKQKKNIKEGSS